MSLDETDLIAAVEKGLHRVDDESEQSEQRRDDEHSLDENHISLPTTATTTTTTTTTTIEAQMSQASSSTVPTSVTTTATLQKIAPKPPIAKPPTVAGSKIVYIKNSNGTSQPIRIGGPLLGQNATAATVNNANASVGAAGSGGGTSAIQFIKTLDGNILQIKNKNVVSMPKSIAPTPTTSVATTNSPTSGATNRRFIVKRGNSSMILTSAGIATKAASNSTTATTNTMASGGSTRTLTASQFQQMGLITSAKLKELVSAATANKTSSVSGTKPTPIAPATVSATGTTTTTVASAKGPPTILNKGVKAFASQKILLPSKSGGNNSTTTTVIGATTTESKATNSIGNVIKLRSPNLRAVQVGGTLQLRVINPSGSSTTTTSTSSTTAAPSNVVKQAVTNGGRQQAVFVQRKILPQTQASTSGDSTKPQFITKKLEVMPVTTIARPKPSTTVQTKSTAILLNNTQKPVMNTSIDIKPALGHSQSFEITTVPKSEELSPTHNVHTVRDKGSSSPDPNNSTMYYSSLKLPSPEPAESANRSRKHCNCTKSQCLKLYCDCFASGEFCQNCNCKECFNTLEKEDERQKAIKICLERNPHAFKPKIGKARDQSDTLRRHTKGCNCKRSGCLKNYCECYEAKIVCSANCKCIGCRNIDETFENNHDRDSSHFDNTSLVKRTYSQRNDDSIKSENAVSAKKPCNFITPDVIEATIQCVIAQADDCQKNNFDTKTSERKILEEFGRCLVEIIDFSKKNNENPDE